MLHDQRTVQVLAALGGDVDAHGSKHAVESVENGLCDLGRGPAAHLMPHHLAGATAHHHNVAPPQPGCLRQLPCGVRRLLPHLFQQVGALYLMNDPSHSYLPFLA